MLGQWNSKVVQCGGTVEQSSWNTVMKKRNSNGGTAWWNRRTAMVEW